MQQNLVYSESIPIILLYSSKSKGKDMTERKDLQAYPETNLSNQLLLHQKQMLQFLFYTNYDVVYETFELKHGSYSQRNRGRMITGFKSQEIAKNYQIVSDKLHLRVLRDDIDLDKQLGKMEILWHNRNIPFFHRYYVLKYMFSAYFQSLAASIAKQEELIRTEEHVYYSLFKSINAREACLRNLKKLLADLSPEDVYEYLHVSKERIFNERRKHEREKYKAQGYKLKLHEETVEGKMSKTKLELFSDCFNHLTKLTLYVLQLIFKWKEYIRSMTHDIRKQKERMEYYFYDDNYLLKILTDLGFLKVSFLNQFYSFAPKNDPFLLQCILGFEKKPQKTIEHELLKLIFIPQKEHLSQIMSKLQILSQEYRYNIRSRKVFDINILKKPMIRAQEKQLNNDQKEQISNLVLKKLQSPFMNKKAKSVTTFRVRQNSNSNKKQKILIEFNKKESPLRKKLISMPGTIQKQIIDMEKDSPLKNSYILQKNENSISNQTVDMNLLNMLKAEVIKKVKQDFQLARNPKSHENEALQVYIDNKVKETMKSIFPFEPQKHVQLPIEFTHVSIDEVNLNTEIENMFKHSLADYRQMQYNPVDLAKIIENSPYVYIIDASIGQQLIGKIFCSLQRDITEFKTLKILYIHFPDLSELEFLIVEVVKYLWKFQNSFEVHLNFFQPSNHQPIRLLIESLDNTLQKSCIFGRKQLYSTVMQVKLIFKRPDKNVNYIPNHYSSAFRLQFSLLFSEKKLMLENRNQHKHLQLLNYDYFLMHAIKRFLTSQDILLLKQKITWKNRLRYILQLIREEEESELMTDVIKQIQASNISELNNTLTKMHRSFLEVSDIVKSNHLSLLHYEVTLTPNYPMKSVYRSNHEQFFRLSLKSKCSVKIDEEGVQFYFFEAKQSKGLQLVFFNARHYHNHAKESDSWLSLYLSQRITNNQHGIRQYQKYIENLWIPMSRFPHKFKDREEMFYHTARVSDLVHLKIDVLLGEKMQFFCSMQMQNSINYMQHDSDVVIQNPYGVAILSIPSNTVIYTRTFL